MHKKRVMRRFTCGKIVDHVGLSLNSRTKSEMVGGGREIIGLMFSLSVSVGMQFLATSSLQLNISRTSFKPKKVSNVSNCFR